VDGERQTQVGLWEGSHRAAEDGSHEVGRLFCHEDDVQPGHGVEGVEKHLEVVELVGVRPEDDEGVVGVLQNGAQQVRDKVVLQLPLLVGSKHHLLEKVCDQYEELQ
jgi:hypothetical protein